MPRLTAVHLPPRSERCVGRSSSRWACQNLLVMASCQRDPVAAGAAETNHGCVKWRLRTGCRYSHRGTDFQPTDLSQEEAKSGTPHSLWRKPNGLRFDCVISRLDRKSMDDR